MGGPPPKKDVPASELFARISQEGPDDRPFELFDFPRKDAEGEPLGKVAVWPLKQREVLAAKAESTRKTREYIKEKLDQGEQVEGYKQVFEDICASEIIFRCCRDPDNRKIPIFPTGAAVREQLTSDEMSALVNAYALAQFRLGPIVATMSDEEFEAWVARLGEGGADFPLHLLSWELKTTLLTRMAGALLSSRTGSSSAGSPPAAPTTEPEKSENTE